MTEGVIESWLVGAEPKFRDIIDGKVRQHRFVCKSNIINHVRFTLKGMIYTGKVVTKVCTILNIVHTSPFVTTFPVYIMPFRVNLTWFYDVRFTYKSMLPYLSVNYIPKLRFCTNEP